jgi:hypothetical protein
MFSLTLNLAYVPGLGGGGELSVNSNGGAGGVSADVGPELGFYKGGGTADMQGRTLATRPFLCP